MAKYSILFFLMAISLCACQEVVDIELGPNTPRLVIDGLVSNKPGPYEVRLTMTTDFFNETAPPGVTDAQVIITDETAGIADTLVLSDPASGLYRSTHLQGVLEHTYHIAVKQGGILYEGRTFMPKVTAIDTLVVRYVDESGTDNDGYRIFLTAREPRDEVNFYRFQTYKNGVLIDNLDNLTILDDEAIGETIADVDLGYIFEAGDTIQVDLHSLTREAYNYYYELSATLNSDGGLLGAPPSNPDNHLTNGILGIFRTSAIETKTVIIQ